MKHFRDFKCKAVKHFLQNKKAASDQIVKQANERSGFYFTLHKICRSYFGYV